MLLTDFQKNRQKIPILYMLNLRLTFPVFSEMGLIYAHFKLNDIQGIFPQKYYLKMFVREMVTNHNTALISNMEVQPIVSNLLKSFGGKLRLKK